MVQWSMSVLGSRAHSGCLAATVQVPPVWGGFCQGSTARVLTISRPEFLCSTWQPRFELVTCATNSREQLQTRYIPEAPHSINVRPLERSTRVVRRDLAPRKSSGGGRAPRPRLTPYRITQGRSMRARWYRREFRQSAHRRDMPRTGCCRWHAAQHLAHA